MNTTANLGTSGGQCGYQSETPGFKTFLDYRAIIICAIAKSWQSKEVWDAVVQDPKSALLKYFGYEFPYQMYLKCNANSAKYAPGTVNDWQAEIFCSVTLVLPPAPQVDRIANETDEAFQQRLYAERAVALAQYNLFNLSFLRKHAASPHNVLAN